MELDSAVAVLLSARAPARRGRRLPLARSVAWRPDSARVERTQRRVAMDTLRTPVYTLATTRACLGHAAGFSRFQSERLSGKCLAEDPIADVGREASVNHFHDLKPSVLGAEVREHRRSDLEQHRHEVHDDLVDERGGQILLAEAAPPMILTSRSPAAWRA